MYKLILREKAPLGEHLTPISDHCRFMRFPELAQELRDKNGKRLDIET
jgi:hypothetical protein